MTVAAKMTSLAARLSVGVLLGAVLLGPAPAFATNGEDNLTVEIVDATTPTPPVVPPGQGGTPPGPPITSPGRGGTTSPPITAPAAFQQTITDPAAADAALGEQSDTMAGLIYVSTAGSTPSLTFHPDGGEVTIVLSIRNVAGETIDGVAQFRITTAWGWQASEVLEVEVLALAPGETRELTATLPGPGQWIFYQTHAEFIPPATVDGVELKPIARTENFMVFPLFSAGIAGVAALGIGGYFWWARVFSRRGVLSV